MATPIVEPIPAGISPEQAFLSLPPGPGLVFLDSAGEAGGLGRWSILAYAPRSVLDAETLDRQGIDPWRAFASWTAPSRAIDAEIPGPFHGGAIGTLSYDLGRRFERLPAKAEPGPPVPDFQFGWYDRFLVFDRESEQGWIVATRDADPRAPSAPNLSEIRAIRSLIAGRSTPPPGPSICGVPSSRHSRESYAAAVRTCLEWIAAGHIYQVNLSHRFNAPFEGDPRRLYIQLRRANPAPFAAYLDMGWGQILSSSPERLLRLDGRSAESRPIKGTRPRGNDPASDARLAADLASSPKDRAELTMIVDLVRNDLGRVCEYGTVRAESVGHVESYETVHHRVGVVRGVLREDRGPCDAIAAIFPGGSITGAPKIRAMEILEDLEPTRRGVFFGSIGYLGADGTVDLNLAIRTLVVRSCGVSFQVGGGIVADSDPEAEYDETIAKAEGMIRAMRSAGGMPAVAGGLGAAGGEDR